MSLKFYKPRTPGRRGMSGINYREALSGDKPLKKLTTGRRSFGDRKASCRERV